MVGTEVQHLLDSGAKKQAMIEDTTGEDMTEKQRERDNG